MLEVGNIKNEAILRDFLPKLPRTSAFCDFSSPCLQSNYCACHEKSEARSYEVLRLSRKVILLQNATPLRKSPPSPPNISDEHVSCTAPATRNASFQILFKCPTPAIVFGHAAKNLHVLLTFDKVHNPLRLPCETTPERPKALRTRTRQFFALLTLKCASRHNGVHFFDISTSKSGPSMARFVHFDLEMCVALRRATTACTFSTAQLLKVLQCCSALSFFTCTCASRHIGVHFFDISTSKSAPNMRCFVHFDFQMCFSPQRRAIFHLSSGQLAPHPPL